MAHRVEELGEWIRKLEENGIKYEIREDEKTVYLFLRKPGTRYNYTVLFRKQEATDAMENRLVNSNFPRKIVEEVLYRKFLNSDSICAVRELLCKFPTSILLLGPPAIGKTYAGIWAVVELIRKGCVRSTYFIHATEVKKERSGFFNFDRDVDLLLIDDIGTEYEKSTIYEVINYRLARKYPVIATSNLEESALEKRYGEMFIGRFRRHGFIKLVRKGLEAF